MQTDTTATDRTLQGILIRFHGGSHSSPDLFGINTLLLSQKNHAKNKPEQKKSLPAKRFIQLLAENQQDRQPFNIATQSVSQKLLCQKEHTWSSKP
jgi:hypothetical protein